VTFERGSSATYATQPFPDGFLAAEQDLQPLRPLPDLEFPPSSETDWQKACQHATFVNAPGTGEAPDGLAELRFLACGDDLFVRARFRRPESYTPIDHESVWNREHLEILLKPFPGVPGMLQFGVAADGETAVLWHGCGVPDAFEPDASARATEEGWECNLRLPVGTLARHISPEQAPDWRFLAGFAVPSALGDFSSWQEPGPDPRRRVPDPLFRDPAGGDFRLADDSPAFALGFVPWQVDKAGPRP
jgi:hypothetical protein